MRGFLGWKIILTVLITFGVLLAALGSQPGVKDFFAAVTDKLSFPAQESSRNVSFSLSIDKPAEISFQSNRELNITIEGQFFGSISEANFSTKKLVIRNFIGSGSINDTVYIKGRFEGLQAEGFHFINKNLEARGSLSTATIENLALDKLQLQGSGKLAAEGAETTLENQKIMIEKPLGRFVLGNGTRIEGLAKKILIGDRFVIG